MASDKETGIKALELEVQISEEQDQPEGPENLTATPFRDYSALTVHQIWYGESSFSPIRPAR